LFGNVKTVSFPSSPLVRSEVEIYFVEPPFSFWIHFAIFEACTLIADPMDQFRVKDAPVRHNTCKLGRERWSVSGDIQDEDKTVESPKPLTVTMPFVIVMQLLELEIPVYLVRLALAIETEREIETNFVEPPFSFRNRSAIFEGFSLIVDPRAQWRVFLVSLWHIACNAGRETGGVSVGVFKMKVKRSTAQNNSQ
jgi:hypothetical protein